MGKWDFLYDIQKEFDFDLSIEKNGAKLTNRNTKESIEVYEEEYYYSDAPEADPFVMYIVCFSTQHAHFDELTIDLLADRFGYTADYISQFEYEIHSWSGKYDT